VRLPFGLVSDAELLDDPEAEGWGFEFTVGVFRQFVEAKKDPDPVSVVRSDFDSDSAIRRRASQCCSSQFSPSSDESGFSQPVALLTASSKRSFWSPPASQMENPLSPSDLMKDPLEVKARGES